MGRRGRRRGALVAGLLAASVALAALVPTAAAAAPRQSTATPQAPPLDPAWFADRPRFEPLDGSPLTVEGIGDYRGTIEVARNPGHATNLAVINDLGLEDYVRGISEVPANWPLEAQKAQAVAARTYALHEAAKEASPSIPYKAVGADICATQGCQVYAGLAKERRPGSEAWIAAVNQTKSQLLLYQGGPINAKYSSSNGGHTVGGGQPYLRPTPDPDDAYSPLHRWQGTYAIGDVVRIAGLSAEPVELHREDTQIVATYVDPEGNPVEERRTVDDFRSRLNNGLPTPEGLPLPVPSNRFDVQVVAGTVQIDGRGWGHGIGLSQYGALGKALRGMKAPDILAAYYSGLKPTALPPEKLPQHVRVALALDQRQVTVTGTAFRVVAADGRILAHRTAGSWTVRPSPERGRLALVPPADQAGTAGATLGPLQPEQPKANKTLQLTINLEGPAAVTRIAVTRPGGAPATIDEPKLRLAGPVQVRLGPVRPGSYRFDLERDAGNGRITTTTLTVDVPAAPGAGTAAPEADDRAELAEAGVDPADLALLGAEVPARPPLPTRALQATATFVLLAVVVLGGLWVGRRPRPELH